MTDWTAGYVADIGYTYGYYPELNPLRVKLAFLNAGLSCPTIGTACELGFGQGLSANFHAAASVTEWHGTDFNPAQAGFARELAAASGAAAKLYDDSFAEFAQRSDLPDFDFIGLHGIWSWISDENRAVIVDFVRRKLKVGGVLYISYNTLPGWAAFAPMRHLMAQHADIIGADGNGIVNRIDGALAFSEKLLATNPLYARANPQVAERVKQVGTQSRDYLAHEYFNRDWHPMHFATMRDWLAPAKLSFACSAHLPDHVDLINLTAEQREFLLAIPDPGFRESTRDFMVNQQFRRDYWVKGARKLSAPDQVDALRAQRVVLTALRADVALKVKGALGEAAMHDDVYQPILDQMADLRPHTLGEIERAVAGRGVALAQLREAVMLLAGTGQIAAAQDEAVCGLAKRGTDKLNQHLLRGARASRDIAYLSSPLTGGGVAVDRFEQLFLMALRQGAPGPDALVAQTWQILAAQGQKIVKDGKVLDSEADNLAELGARATAFAEKKLQLLKALQIA